MDHFGPHTGVPFEGYYTRFHLPSGGSLLIILCEVSTATDGHPVNLHITYVPPQDSGHKIWQAELWPKSLDFHKSKESFTMTAPIPSTEFTYEPDANFISIHHTQSKSHFHLRHTLGPEDGEELELDATLHSHTPWDRSTDKPKKASPESWLANLPLPLHWHVLSTYSPCELTFSLPRSAKQYPADARPNMQAVAHLEKNWAVGFPAAHVWVQGIRVPDAPSSATSAGAGVAQSELKQPHTLNLAGGLILSLEAYLVGYRNPSANIALDFRPPWSVSFLPLLSYIMPASWLAYLAPVFSPFMRVTREWEKRRQIYSFSSLFWKLDITAQAPKERFYNFAAPMPMGFEEEWMSQSLDGTAEVQVWRRRFPGLAWEKVVEDWFEGVGVEFGGLFFPERGSKVGGRVRRVDGLAPGEDANE